MVRAKDGISASTEDYLKVIYDLIDREGHATTTQIAQELNIRPASVTGMLKKMAESKPALVRYKKHHGVSLTQTGKKLALETIRHHRLLEEFLHEVLGFSWDKVHDEAHRLEHVISEEFEEKMAELLGNPEYDPHGSPIPTRDLEMPEYSRKRLGEMTKRERAYIREVPDDDANLLRYLESFGIVPGARIEILEHSPYDENLTFIVMGQAQNAVLGPSVTSRIFVEKKR